MRLVVVAGTRPNLPKVAALVAAARAFPDVEIDVVHTRQHHDHAMYAQLMEDLGLPTVRDELPVATGLPPAEFVAAAREALAARLRARPPAAVIVVGDVNSTLAGALGACDAGVPVAHVEAGLRSFDPTMPEEANRIAVDRLSRWWFTTEAAATDNLRAEGFHGDGVRFVGNTMIDSLMAHATAARARHACRNLGLAPRGYAVLTLHRPATVDEPARLREMLDLLEALGRRLPVVFPVHPRTQARIREHADRSLPTADSPLRLTRPLGYLDFVSLMADAALVLTDSGGVQEETTMLDVPCLTLRDNTERPVTTELGSNRLVGRVASRILAAVDAALRDPPRTRVIPPLWDGRAGERVLRALASSS